MWYYNIVGVECAHCHIVTKINVFCFFSEQILNTKEKTNKSSLFRGNEGHSLSFQGWYSSLISLVCCVSNPLNLHVKSDVGGVH